MVHQRIDLELIGKLGLSPLLTIQRAAEVRGCHRTQIFRYLKQGRIRAVKDGRKTLIDTISLLDDMLNLPDVRDVRVRPNGSWLQPAPLGG